ncbi:hypothetical protein BT96DRAFT_817561, partial [Gymnopus androsaceus JB14]
MRKRRVPERLVLAVSLVLKNRKTRIHFGDFLSEPISLTNGIGQGDPLSMIAYLFYNADFFDIKDDKNVVVDVGDMTENVAAIKTFMERPGGGFEWSDKHNSKFEPSKLVLIH